MKLTKLHLALGITALAMTAESVNAATVLIDWSALSPVTNPGTGGNYWNSLGAGSGADLATTALVDTGNNATGFSVAVDSTLTNVSGNNYGSAFGGSGIAGPTGAAPFDEPNAVIDGIFANYNFYGTSVITLTGLAISTQYDFVAIGGRASNGATGLITVNVGTSGSASYDLLNDGTLLSFSVTSTAGGEIAFDFSEKSNDTVGTSNATWNAMSMTQVPEPSAALLGGLGMLALLRRRR